MNKHNDDAMTISGNMRAIMKRAISKLSNVGTVKSKVITDINWHTNDMIK